MELHFVMAFIPTYQERYPLPYNDGQSSKNEFELR